MNDHEEFQVVWSAPARLTLEDLLDQFTDADQKQSLRGTVVELDQRFRANPAALGEIYRRRGAIAEHSLVYGILGGDFAIDEMRKIVYVRKLRLMARRDIT